MQKFLTVAIGLIGIIIAILLFRQCWQKTNSCHLFEHNSNTPNLEALMIGQTKAFIGQALSSLEYYNILDDDDKELFNQVMTVSLKRFEKNGTGNSNEFKAHIIAAADTLRDLMRYEAVADNVTLFFRIANIEYGRHHRLNFAETIIDEWIAGNIPFADRLNNIRDNVLRATGIDYNDSIERGIVYTVKNSLLHDIDKVSKDSVMSREEYKTLVVNTIDYFETVQVKTDDGKNLSMVYLVSKTYHDISKLLNVDVSELLIDWFEKQTEYTPPGFDELEKQINEYISFMKKVGIVNERERNKIKLIVDEDIKLFRVYTDKELLINTAISSLNKIEQMAGDTEDREVFARFYCDLALNKGFSIGKQVEGWMYGSFDEELEAEAANKLPWER